MLPILERRAEIEAAIRAHPVVVICGETGSGKTTQLPQICDGLGLSARGMIGHTQPRRLAARAVAARIAEEMGVRLGAEVGVKVRFEDQTSRATRITLMTDGMLLAELGADAVLRSYSTIIIDEAHERSLNVDFLLGYLRNLRERRPDLKIIITSATIDPARFSAFFGGPSVAPVIEVSGRTYPVEIRYDPPSDDDDPARINPERVADAVEELLRPSLPAGDVLVFLPGEGEIRGAAEALRRRDVGSEVLPLFARLSSSEQDRIFHPSGTRRVILATNVAETSLTVPGIRYVVDTGLARQSRYDPARKVQCLPIEPVSQASARQRSGRCGRVADGVCIRMYSEASYRSRPVFTEPEIRRTNLAGVVLQMKTLNLGPIEEFPLLDPPEPRAVADAYETLFELGAIDAPASGGAITRIGRDLSRLPLDPRVGRMMLAADAEGSLREVTVLAGALSIQDPRERAPGRHDEADRAQLVFRNETSDMLTLLNIWEQHGHAARERHAGGLRDWCREHSISFARMREWADTVRQLREVAADLSLRENASPAAPDAIHRAMLTGLISNVACREADARSFEYRSVRGGSVSIFPGSALFKKAPKWIMAAEMVHTTKLYARTVAKIDFEWIEELAGHMLERRLSDHHLDAETGEPSAWERVTMSGIVVIPRRRAALAKLDAEAARDVFIREALVLRKWTSDAPFMRHNEALFERARGAEARLRKRGLIRDDAEIAAWFEARLPRGVRDPASLRAWLASGANGAALELPLDAVLQPRALAALDEAAFPGVIRVGMMGEHADVGVEYALAPGKDEDGVTISVPLATLPLIGTRAEWLVPGLLPDLLAALVKTLPRATRAKLDACGTPETIGEQCAGVMTFGEGPLLAAFVEAIEVMAGVKVDPAEFSFKAAPSHLRARIRVVDEHGKELGIERDAGALLTRFEARIRRARAAGTRARFEREHVTAWDFDALPERVPVEQGGEIAELHPAIVDTGSDARLTLVESAAEAAVLTHQGVRRLFALACAGEVEHRLEAMGEWDQMVRHYQALGSASQLRSHLVCQVAERAFMSGRSMVRTREEFETRVQESWGRLAVVSREVVEVVASVLEWRAKVAQRLASGTPRLWADSVADIREHAAYLMPAGFLLYVPWEQLRHFPRYAEAMRERLFALRESGSGIEKGALQQFAPCWKQFTGWVAAAMSAQASGRAEAGEPEPVKSGKGPKSPLPQTRRNSPSVNVDAGVWALLPGNLPVGVTRYRWALEEARIGLFVPSLAGRPPVSLTDLAAMWKKVESPARP